MSIYYKNPKKRHTYIQLYELLVHCNRSERDAAFHDSGILMNLCELLVWLNDVRLEFGHPIFINSGYRDKLHNMSCGGVLNSDHLLGLAVDVTTESQELTEDLYCLIKNSFIPNFSCDIGQCIYYKSKNFIHISLNQLTHEQEFIIK